MNRCFSCMASSRRTSARNVRGRFRRRSVWPVGAVSTTRRPFAVRSPISEASSSAAKISSLPGRAVSTSGPMSASSRYVPRSRIARITSPHRAMNRVRSAPASSIRAWRRELPNTSHGSSSSVCPSTVGRARAGSVESTSVDWCALARSAIAAEQVVLPTPPFPTTSVIRGSRATSASAARASRFVVGSAYAHGSTGYRLAEALTPIADLTEPRHDLRLAPPVFLVVDVAELQLHLQLHQLLLDGRVVRELLFGHLQYLVQGSFDPRDRVSDRKEED